MFSWNCSKTGNDIELVLEDESLYKTYMLEDDKTDNDFVEKTIAFIV